MVGETTFKVNQTDCSFKALEFFLLASHVKSYTVNMILSAKELLK